MFRIISQDGNLTGDAVLDEELSCSNEGCNGNQYVVTWEDGEVTVVCGKGLDWSNETTAQIKQ